MLFSQRSWWAAPLVALIGVAGCSDTTNPQAAPEASASGSAASVKRDKLPTLSPAAKIDPLVMKAYRAQSCFYGTLSLKQARAAYLGSLGGAEPGAGKIPAFGVDLTAPEKSDKPEAPKAAGSAAASAAPAASAKPAASAAPAATGSAGAPGERPAADKLRVRSVPYERFARSCTVAAGLKNPAAPEFDKALAEFAPFAVQLAKDLAMANTYYQKEQYKSDEFAKGKEYHKKLTESFAKLDEHHQKLGAALDVWQKANPLDASAHTESQKLATAAGEEARLLLVALDAGGEKDALATAVGKVEAATAALKKAGEAEAAKSDPWPRILVPALENYTREVKAVLEGDPKAAPADKLVGVITMYTRVLESNHRALTRSLTDKAGVRNPRLMRPQMPPGHPQ